MKTIDILGDNRFETYTKTRVACRGIVVNNGKMLVSHEDEDDLYLIPGGGLEKGETLGECVCREVLEETGYTVTADREFLVINEFYEEYKFETHYFVCSVTGTGERSLTDHEREVGLEPWWCGIGEVRDVFSHHADYAATSEEKRGMYLREHTALEEFIRE